MKTSVYKFLSIKLCFSFRTKKIAAFSIKNKNFYKDQNSHNQQITRLIPNGSWAFCSCPDFFETTAVRAMVLMLIYTMFSSICRLL